MTIVEILVVLVIVTALVALLVSVKQPVRDVERKSTCGNNQRQIVLAMLVYANENDGAWPCRRSDAAGHLVTVAGRDKFSSIGSFEFLAVQTGLEMPAKVFACPSAPTTRPHEVANAALAKDAIASSVWCVAAAGNPGDNPGYVYDWAVPPNALAERVVTADRGRGSVMHRKIVMACFGDGHVSHLMVSATTDTTATPNLDDLPCAIGAVNSDADGDDIYTGIGDGDDCMTPGKGSATRAWVR